MFNHPLSIKLDSSNNLLWKKQVQATIKGHKFQSFVTEPKVPPIKFLENGGTNPDYEH